ncbi:MAG: SufD family Fe-S cluster assembly protein [Bacteroidales bacterium]|nr:SufD family Fe-S cluster assembly protein [Bacteroidales bacterium]MBP5373569.1 SufD family Fe-S cluster assembly protein [Bacteroidales bacterium]
MGHGRYIDPFLERRPDYVIGQGEQLSLEFVILPGEDRSIDLGIDLAGEGASLDVKIVYLSGYSEKVDIKLLVHHRAGGCSSQQRIFGIASGSAQVGFYGKVVTAPDAQKTEASQLNRNILLSDAAQVRTLPQLEIYADDVKCSHGATIGRLNEDELFYMRSRGIPEAEARALQMLSFLSPVVPEGQQERIEAAVRSILPA